MNNQPKYPCRNCIYFKACGETTRTMPCKGRETKSQKKREMTLKELENWALSSYNEGTEDQLDYYINERKCDIGDKAYLYYHDDGTLTEMKIVHIIARSDAEMFYDLLPDNILCDMETEYDADTSAEFITDNDCYLVWLRETNK